MSKGWTAFLGSSWTRWGHIALFENISKVNFA